MEKLILAISVTIMVILGVGIGYMVWVGIFWLINTVFGLALNIWWGGLFGIIAMQILRSIFGKNTVYRP